MDEIITGALAMGNEVMRQILKTTSNKSFAERAATVFSIVQSRCGTYVVPEQGTAGVSLPCGRMVSISEL